MQKWIGSFANLAPAMSFHLIASAVWRRITDIAGLERAGEAHWRNLMAALPDTVIVSDADGRIVFVNPAVERFFGYRPEQLIGQMVEILVPQQVHARHVAHRAAYRAEPKRRSMGSGLDLRALRADGTEFAVAVSLGLAETKAGMVIIATIQDMTVLRQRDRSIEDLNNRLSRDNAELKAVNNELEAFSYSVSHDLRAPLRSIDGFSRVLQEDYEKLLDEDGRDCTARIRQSTQHMGALIDDMLKLSRISRIDLTRTHVDLSEMAREIATTLQTSAPDREAEFDIASGLKASGDSNLLRIALDNVMNNAWKFTAGRSPTRIEFGQKPVDGKTAYYVRDNGVGFDMAYVGKLFGAFQRLHDAREFPGTGIGLATVQRIINKHGGRVWAEAEPDKGATFYFTL